MQSYSAAFIQLCCSFISFRFTLDRFCVFWLKQWIRLVKISPTIPRVFLWLFVLFGTVFVGIHLQVYKCGSSYHCSTYLSAQPDLCSALSCYSLFICLHPFSTTYIFFSKNYQSLVSLYITSSLESTSCLIPSALHKTPCWWCHTL